MLVVLHGGAGVLGLHIDYADFASIEKKVNQIALQESDCRNFLKDITEKEGFFMGYGGALTLVNGSPFDWVLNSAPSYQMDAWQWPTVTAGMLSRKIKLRAVS